VVPTKPFSFNVIFLFVEKIEFERGSFIAARLLVVVVENSYEKVKNRNGAGQRLEIPSVERRRKNKNEQQIVVRAT